MQPVPGEHTAVSRRLAWRIRCGLVSRALDAQQDVLDYTSMLYNIKRLHSYLDYMSPNGYKRQLMERRKAA